MLGLCREEDLVFRFGFLELQLETLVLFDDRRRVLGEGCEFGLELFDVAFFALAECALTGKERG